MTILTVTAKGQVTLKKEVLKHLDVKPGDKLRIVALPEGKIELSATKPAQDGSIDAFFGCVKNEHDIHLTIDELQQEIENAWAGRR